MGLLIKYMYYKAESGTLLCSSLPCSFIPKTALQLVRGRFIGWGWTQSTYSLNHCTHPINHSHETWYNH